MVVGQGSTSDGTVDAAEYTEVCAFYARHMHLLDAGSANEWAETFVEDGTFTPPSGTTVRGRSALAAAVRSETARLAAAQEVRRHWHGMITVYHRPDGALAARCYALIFATVVGGDPVLRFTCVCEDVLVRDDGILQVRARVVSRDDMQPVAAGARDSLGGGGADGEKLDDNGG